MLQICNHCGGGGGVEGEAMDIEDTHVVCQSLECGVYFERNKMHHELRNMRHLSDAAMKLLEAAGK
jgi:hypothetical protein